MVYIINDFSQDNLANLLKEIKRKKKKTSLVEQSLAGAEYQESDCNEWKKDILAKHYGSLIRGLDGVEYQKTVRNEWD